MATWASNGADTGGSGSYVPGTQSVQYIHDNFAANGDTITLPSGTFTWSNGTLLSKTVTIQGASYTPNTAINCSSPGAPTLSTTVSTPSQPSVHPYAIGINLPSSTGFIFRITGITFSGLPASAGFSSVIISGSGTTDNYRVDNCLFTTTNGSVIMMQITGNSTSGAPWGLVDHSTFIAGGGSEMIHYPGWGSGATGGWSTNLTPGTETMNYQEDCIFQLNGYATATSQGSIAAFECFYGAQVVARYNLLNFAFYDCHGNVDVNTRWFEIYKNQFFVPSTNTGVPFFCNMRAGSGVIWGNTLAAGSQTSPTSKINLYTDQALPTGGAGGPSGGTLSPQIAGPAPEYGPGAGIFSATTTSQGPTSSPVYIWGNDANMTVVTSIGVGNWNPSPIAANSNYFVSSVQPSSMTISEKASQIGGSTYSYSPYTYPHPFTGLSNTPGSGLTAVADASITRTVLGVSASSYSPPGNNYFACFSSQFTNSTKGGATEWSNSVNTTYARVAMGGSGGGWSIAAYANSTGVVWNNLNAVATAGVVGANQTLFALGFCDSITIGGGNINFFIDLSVNLAIDIGFCALLPAATGAVFTSY